MPLKTATYLKSSTLRWPRRQPSELLSVDMISLPLGDLRHLAHIGLEARGHAFADPSAFHGSRSHQDLYRNSTPPPPPKPPRLLSPEEMAAQSLKKPRPFSHAPPQHKKSHSLPLLDVAERRAEPQPEGGASKQPEGGASEPDANPCLAPGATEEELSFVLDLGPSILEDVLQVMDKL